jgi:hypothetical protein
MEQDNELVMRNSTGTLGSRDHEILNLAFANCPQLASAGRLFLPARQNIFTSA